MEKRDMSFIKHSLWCWVELQLSTLLSLASTFSVYILRAFAIDDLAQSIFMTAIEIIAVNLLIFWRFYKGPSDEPQAFKEYLPPVITAFALHLTIGLIPFAVTVGQSPNLLAKLAASGFESASTAMKLPFGKIWSVFALLCIPKFISSLLAFPFRKHRNKKNKNI